MNIWQTAARRLGLVMGLAAAFGFIAIQLAVAIPPPPPPGNGQPEPLAIRYARAEVALAEAGLNKVEGMNKRVRGAVSGDVAHAYQRDLDIAKLQLQVALGENKKTEFDVWLRRAESAAGDAEMLWRGAVAANQRAAGAVDSLEVERLRQVFQLAKLELERGQNVAQGTAEARLAWQLEFVNGQVERALDQLRQSTPSSRVYLFDR
jgi:hypothetical protein